MSGATKQSISLSDLNNCLKSRFFLAGLLLAILVWLLDPFIDAVIINTGPFHDELFSPNTHEIYTRSAISIIIIIYSFISSFIFFRVKKTRSELANTSNLLKKVINSSQDLIFIKDTNLRTMLCNDAFAKAVGKSPEDMYGKTDIENGWDPEFIYGNPEKGIRGYEADDREVLAGKTIRINAEPVNVNNETRYFGTIKTPFRNEKGEIIGLLAVARDVTERMETEVALQYSEQRYRSLIEATTSIVWATGESGEFEVPQTSWEKFTGQPWEEHKGFGWTKKIHPDDIKHILAEWEKACAEKTLYATSGRLWNAELNEWRNFEARAIPIDEADGTFREWVGIITDVTERKKIELELQKSEQRLRESQELARLGNWYWDINTGEVEWSDEVYNIFRLNPDKFTPQIDSIMSLSPWPEDNERHKEIIQRALDTRSTGTFEQRFMRPDGTIGSYYSTFQGIFDENDELTALKGTVQDITERKQAEEAIKESEEKFRAIYESTDVGIALCNMDGTLVEMNQGYLDMIGYTEEEAKQLSYWDLTPNEYEKQEQEQLRSLHETGKYGPYEKEYIHKKGYRIPVLLNGMTITTPDGETLIWSLVQDITNLKQAQEELSYNASHDLLTGLFNRREFEDRIEYLFSKTQADNSTHALLYMDLDQFKIVNDTCGHFAGDELLRQLSLHLQKIVRKRDTLARLGGDEFAVLMEDCSLDDAQRVATSIQKAVEDFQFMWEERTFKLGISIGLVSISETTASITELLRDADTACYMAKESGRNRIHVYNAEDSEVALRQGEMQWVTRLYQALDKEQFCLYAQIIEPLHNETGKHYELLVRMIDEYGNIVLPHVFLPAAERYNLISKIDYWVIKNFFNTLKNYPVYLKQIGFCSINLSGQSLNSPDILELITNLFKESDIPGNKICFEITETAAITNLSKAMDFISTLKGLGCRFALDDFGSGLSSFAYLKNLPVDYLKIDGVFVKDIADDPIDHAMVKSINEIGQVMGMQTIAEFVENDIIKGMLKEIGVNYAQGYGIGRPVALSELIEGLN